MARKRSRPTGNNVVEKISKELEFFKNSPLSALADLIEVELNYTKLAINRGEVKQEDLIKIAYEGRLVLKILPRSFEKRFAFDSQLIDAISSEWNHKKQLLSIPIIPRHGDSHWEHQKLTFPVIRKFDNDVTNDNSVAVTVIRFPQFDNLDSIRLLDYPFLYHELAHNMFFYDGKYFIDLFSEKLNNILSRLRLRAVADQGSAKDKAIKMLDKVQQVWEPTPSQHNWAHELAMDIVALWTCGPAYLASFEDELEHYKKDWFYLDQNHPPYAIRVECLINAAHKLGWNKYTESMDRLLSQHKGNWRNSKNSDTNTYVALTFPQLIDECISAILSTCENYSLPLCNSNSITRVENKIKKKIELEFGTEVILAAWLYEQQNGYEKYETWEHQTIQMLFQSITS